MPKPAEGTRSHGALHRFGGEDPAPLWRLERPSIASFRVLDLVSPHWTGGSARGLDRGIRGWTFYDTPRIVIAHCKV